MKRFLPFLTLAVLGACHSSQHALSGDKPLVELQTGACFGYCPVIRLTVYSNGYVEYEGKNFAERMGRDSFQLTKTERKRLRQQVQAVDLWQYEDRIKSNVVDAPSATLTAYKNGQKKSVTGSIDRPEPLLELERLIKDLAEAHGLNVKRGVNPKEPPLSRRLELVVTLQPELNAGNWINTFKSYRLLLIRRVSAENKWIVAFDPAEISETALLDLFKKSEGVITAEPYSKQ